MSKKLCKIAKEDWVKNNQNEFYEIAKKPKYYCTKCIRAASDKSWLCKPKKLEKE
ncbi:MAG: hypothetical protein MJB14_07275 [Spirochaetes bacterium]|nr:hypothetical protein [Spirochaetota bacterium]